jgi:membrane-associated protein
VIAQLLDLFLHLDAHLYELVSAYGPWVYLILFLVVFAETGVVVTPFLPGDSLLFATGAIAATGALDPNALIALLLVAAVLGDACNYWIGRCVGPKVFTRQKSWFFNPEHLRRTHAFYEKHGGKTIIIARFVPIIRTFAPFVAGVGEMGYRRFFSFNVIGALLWVPTLVYAGYFFGNLPFVKQNFSLVIFAIIGLSVLPMVVEFVRHRRGK